MRTVEYLRINNTDLEVSRVGFGCWAIGGHGYGRVDDKASVDAIHAALDLGVNFFDTSDVYGFGHSETVLGRALRGKGADVVVATKFGVGWDTQGRTYKDCSPGHILKSVDQSLARLGLETIPLYQINWHDGVTPLGDIVTTLERCRRAGKVRHFGYCNMSTNELGEYQKFFVTSQLEYGLGERKHDAELGELSRNGISTLAYGVLSRGLLSGKFDFSGTMRFGKDDTRSRDPNFNARLRENLRLVENLKRVTEATGKSPTQVAIRWALDGPGVSCALVGIKTSVQALENAGGAGWQLGRSNWEWLAQAGAST